jgi:UDP-N-acetylglucosamine--N-acetylmuramyl-(pentapeptide) pyrophosphoryl-undecaprenol N-acetylglucosamine transferase
MKLVIAGGGTGGHVAPGLAVAKALLKAEPESEVLWLGQAGSIEAGMVAQAGLPFGEIRAAGLKRSFQLGNLSLPWKVAQGLRDSLLRLGAAEPDAVLVTGGFVSLPVGLAAWLKKVPLVVHESNAVAGLANRLLAKWADRVCVGFAPEGPLPEKTVATGNPTRLAGKLPPRARSLRAFGLKPGRKTLFVFPGSRAAHRINLAVAGALGRWSSERKPIQVLWMCGQQDLEEAKRAAQASRIPCAVRPFIHEVALAYGCADLVLARAGASTLAELTALGLPALLVPYPHATGGHQDANAAWLQRAGGAEVLADWDLDAEQLAGKVSEMIFDGKRLKSLAAASKKMGKPEAAQDVVKAIQEAMAC